MERAARAIPPGRHAAGGHLDRQSTGQSADAGLQRGDPAVRISLQSLNAAGLHAARFRAMGSPCEVLVDSALEQSAQAVAGAGAACAWRIERKFSRYRADSVVAHLNRAAGTRCEVDAETAQLLDFAEHMWRISEGRFDITSGVLRRAWKFDGGTRVPTRAQIGALLPLVGWPLVTWQRPYLTL